MRQTASIALFVLVAAIGFAPPAHASPLPGEGAAVEVEEGPAASTVVGNTGDANWTVPIELPPGPGGFAPALALQYSSSRGDGPFGVGWTLPAGSIACSTRFGVPAYILTGGSACPRFELDGGLLNDAGGGRYHTFVESFQRVLHVTSGGQNHWEVTSPDGVTRRYGTGPNSRILGPGNTIVRWLLSEVENPYGQVLRYGYDGDPADPDLDSPTTGFTYLATIAYGPSSGGSNPERQVVVSYETRPDAIRDYSGGVLRHIAYRASSVEVRSHGALHSRYLLGWSLPGKTYTTIRSRLSSIQRVGDDGTSALPPIEFSYTDASDVGGEEWEPRDYEDDLGGTGGEHISHFGLNVGHTSYPAATVPSIRTGDIDGDGLVDILVSDQAQKYPTAVYLNSAEISSQEPQGRYAFSGSWRDALRDLSFLAPRLDVAYVDGNTDAVCDATYTTQPTPVHFGNEYYPMSLAVSFSLEYDGYGEPPADPYVALAGNFHLVDLNADGLSDLVMSVDISGIYVTHDCETGALLPQPEYREPPNPKVRVVFRNTGDGWVEDPALAQGLPPFGILFTEGPYAYQEIWGGWPTQDRGCYGFIDQFWDPSTTPSGYYVSVYPCISPKNLSPQFVDLNGDGRLDLIVASADDDSRTLLVSNWEYLFSDPPPYIEQLGTVHHTAVMAHSRAWLSQADGSWARDPSFDPPFHHTRLEWGGCGGGCAHTLDRGVRIQDLNRDGYADISWDGVTGQASGVEDVVLLNRGGGDGTAHSAWCSSRAVPTNPSDPNNYSPVPDCPQEAGAERLVLPSGERFYDPGWEHDKGTQFADVNGDGWLDLVRSDYPNRPEPKSVTYLYSPGSDPSWIIDSRFTAPAFLGLYPGAGLTTIPADVRMFDLNGDGAADFIRGDGRDHGSSQSPPRESWVGGRALADLLSEVTTSQGGVVSIEYAGAVQQQDEALEALASTHAFDALEEPSEADPVRWAELPVVRSVTVTALNSVPAETRYLYAHPRHCLEHRERHGFRLVRRTGPDGSVSDTYFHQHHGRAGRLSRRVVSDASGPLQSVEEIWELPAPASVTGAWAGVAGLSEASHVGRLASRRTSLEYGTEVGDVRGAVQVENFYYNDSHGYNMLLQVESQRASTHTLETRFPRVADTGRWILNRIETQQLHRSGGNEPFARLIVRSYTGEGALATEKVWRNRRDGLHSEDPPPAETSYVYDEYGNRIQHTDPRGHATDFCYDGVPSNPPWCVSPAGQTSGSVLVGRRDPPVGESEETGIVTQIVPDPVFGVPTSVDSGYSDEPTRRVALDVFGREVASFLTPRNWPREIQLTRTEHWDFEDPLYTVMYAYTEEGQPDAEAIRTVQVGDGFGGAWKQVRQADVPSSDKHVGTAVYRDPTANLSAQTYDYACTDAESLCSNVTGTNETAAVVTLRDALGRPTEVQTPDGTSLFHYRAGVEPVVGPDGVVADQAVDVVLEQNAKGDLTKRWLDGDRLLAVEECTNSDPGRDAAQLALDTCATGGPNRTLYGYHTTGQLESIVDPLGSILRYHYDTAGQVIRIDDPDAGVSYTEYDEAGNVALTGNLDDNEAPVPSRERVYAYDALNRLIGITTPPGEIDYTLAYRPGEIQLGTESNSDYTRTNNYDVFGRLWRHWTDDFQAPDGVYRYDLQGRRIERTHGAVNTIGYVYQGAYLKQVQCQGWDCGAEPSIVSDVVYDSLGRPEELHHPGGVRRFEYSADDRRLLTQDEFSGSSGYTRLNYEAHDALRNIERWSTESTLGGLDDVGVGTYAYDHRNRLASWSHDAGLGASGEFRYDPLGNLIAHGTPGGVKDQYFEHQSKPHAISRKVDPTTGTTLKSYEYDDWGNVTRAGANHYRYDSADRMVCASSTPNGNCDVLRVVYDAQGERYKEVALGETRIFVGHDYVRTHSASTGYEWRVEVSAFGNRVAYLVEADNGNPQASPPWAFDLEIPPGLVALPPLAVALWLLWLAVRGGLLVGIARRPGSSTLTGFLVVVLVVPFPVRGRACGGGGSVPAYRWVMSDPVGSGLIELDVNGNLVRQLRFKPFGGLDAETSPSPRRFYAGHPRQEETGLMYMRARWMDPDSGVFLSVDPMARATAPRFFSESDARLDELMELSSGVRQRGENASEVDASSVGNANRFQSEDSASFDPYRPSAQVGSSRPNSKIKLYKWDPPVGPKPKRPGSRGSDSEDDDWGPFSGPDGELAGLGMDPAVRRGDRPDPQFVPPRWTAMDGPELARLIASNPYPYAYGLNNPISFRDPDGELWLQVTAWVLLVTFTTMAVTSPSQPNPAFQKPPGAPPKVPGSGAANSPTLPPPSRPVPEFVPNIQ